MGRTWFVASVIYGAVVGAIIWQAFPRIESTPYEASQLRRLSDRSLEILAGRIQSPATQADPKWKDTPIFLEMPNGYRFEVLGNTPNEQSQEVPKDYVKVLASIVKEKRLAAIQSALLVRLVPCLVTFSLGWLFDWVYRGFGKRA